MSCLCVVNAGHPPRVKSSVIPVMLLLVYNQKPTGLHRLDKAFYFGVPYSLEQPESFRGCHNLKPYRHIDRAIEELNELYKYKENLMFGLEGI